MPANGATRTVGRRSDVRAGKKLASAVDKALHYYERFDRRLRAELKRLITDELIAEHRKNPLGEHGPQSEALRRVVNYFRRAPQAGKYVIVAVVPWREYRLGLLGAARGEAPKLLDEPVFASEAEALHGVFLARVRELQSP
jgi:branched-chain amino acid transport system permease protein